MASFPLARANPPPVKILPLGDSITRGNNDINYPNGDILGGYRKGLGIRLSTAGVAFDFLGTRTDNAASGMDPHHDGTPGIRTDEVLAVLPTKLAASPDTVLMMLGTNDILQNKPVATAAANLSNLIEQITGSAPARRLYVATIPPITQAWPPQPPNVPAATLNTNANLYNTEVRNLVAQHAARGLKVKLVDISALLVLTDPNPAKNFYQPGDGIHPGQAGYDQLAELWFNGINTGGPWVDAPVTGLPAAPSGLLATVASPSRINLTWTDNAANESVYRIRRRELPGGVWQEIAVLPPDTTSHAVTGLTTGAHSYAFTVIASNTCGNSAWSEIAASPAPIDHAHLNPAVASSIYNTYHNASMANNGDLGTIWHSVVGGGPHHWQVDLTSLHHIQQVRLITRQDTYDDPAQRKNFEIRASNDPAFATYTVLASHSGTPLPLRGTLTMNVTNRTPFRHVRVAKTDGANFSICLLQVMAADPVTVPDAPAGLTALAVDSSHVRLSWHVLSSNESGFKLERKTGVDGTYGEIAAPSAGTSMFVDSGLPAETAFSYRIRSTNEAGDSAYSAEASVTTRASAAFDLWAAAYHAFLALPPAERDAAADPNGDGVNNLLAYALGLDPLLGATPDVLPRIQASASDPHNLFYRFRRNKIAVDLDCAVMASSTLSGNDWSVLSLAGAIVSDVEGDDGVEEVSVPILPPAGESKRFFRLRVFR